MRGPAGARPPAAGDCLAAHLADLGSDEARQSGGVRTSSPTASGLDGGDGVVERVAGRAGARRVLLAGHAILTRPRALTAGRSEPASDALAPSTPCRRVADGRAQHVRAGARLEQRREHSAAAANPGTGAGVCRRDCHLASGGAGSDLRGLADVGCDCGCCWPCLRNCRDATRTFDGRIKVSAGCGSVNTGSR